MDSVVFFRATPKQKAEVVELIKERIHNISTLAIGDGANDVNMITSAHVGVGILGKEGKQAARASDYAIGQFSFLKRLLLVHGRESYRKNTFIVCYNFYKNCLFVMPQFWFGIYSLYSGQTLYDPWIYQFFNITFTSLPIIWFGIYDLESDHEILEFSKIHYIQGLIGKLFHSIRFWKWVLYGAFQGLILFFFYFFSFYDMESENGKGHTLWSIGSMVYFGVVIIVNLRILYSTSNHNFISGILFILSILSYFFVVFIMSKFSVFENFNNFSMIHSLKFYLVTLLCCVLIYALDSGVNKMLILYGCVKDPLKLDKKLIEDYRINSIKKNLKINLIANENDKDTYKIVDVTTDV